MNTGNEKWKLILFELVIPSCNAPGLIIKKDYLKLFIEYLLI